MTKFRRQHDRNSSAKMSGFYFKFIVLIGVILMIGALFGKRVFDAGSSGSSESSQDLTYHSLDGHYESDSTFTTGGSYLPYATYGEVIVDPHYSIAYAERHEQPIWVAYELTADRLRNQRAKRNDWFEMDDRVTTQSAHHGDYIRSGYTRGHMAPAQDFAFSQEAMDQTFLMSNITPQLANFNGGIWRELEELVRDWALENEHLYIVSGPIFEDGKKLEKIGKNGVSVPHAFYKVILDNREPERKGIAFVIPHEVTDQHLENYATNIRFVEDVTGIDFFSDLLDTDLQDSLEMHYDITQWAFDKQKYNTRVNTWNKRKN